MNTSPLSELWRHSGQGEGSNKKKEKEEEEKKSRRGGGGGNIRHSEFQKKSDGDLFMKEPMMRPAK